MTPIQIRDRLLQTGMVTSAEMQGCTPQEIEKLEQQVGHILPRAYKDFLLAIGHGAGQFLRGTDVFFGSTMDTQLLTWAKELFIENGLAVELLNDAFVFTMHQGYACAYFRLGEGDDPPVYEYIEGSGPPQLAWRSFTAYLRAVI